MGQRAITDFDVTQRMIRLILKRVGIEQKLNQQLPLDLVFRDDTGKLVKLGDYFGKRPVVLSMVYYECPMLCGEVMNGMSSVFSTGFWPGLGRVIR